MAFADRLNEVRCLVQNGIEEQGVVRILQIIGAPGFPLEILNGMRLYSEYLPMAAELGFTSEQRYLHFLWDVLDSKGGIKIGNYVCLTEGVQVFTHGHSEDTHSKRDYNERGKDLRLCQNNGQCLATFRSDHR